MPTNTLNPLALIDTAGEAVKALAPRKVNRKVQFAEYNGGSTGGIALPYLDGTNWVYPANGNGDAPDFAALAANPERNRVVRACVQAKAVALSSAPSTLEQLVKGQWERVETHPVLDLLKAPNGYHSVYDLWQATISSEDTRGQAFWRIEFCNDKTPGELWVEHPSRFDILGEGDAYISGYRFRKERGDPIELLDRDVIHFRKELDLYNGRLGVTPLGSGYPQVHGDNAAAIYQAAILDNAGVMSLLISMKEGLAVGNGVVTSQIEQFVQALKRKLAQRGAGSIAGVNLPLDVNKMGYSPDEMAISELIRYFTVSICALLDVDPIIIHMAGGADAPTYANYKEAKEDFWERTIVPTHKRHDATLSTQLLPLFNLDPAEYRLGRDYSEIPALQEDKDAKHARYREDYKAGAFDLFQYQTFLGLTPTDDMKGKFYTPPAKPAQASDDAAPSPATNGTGSAKTITLNGQEVHFMNGKADDETKAIDPTDETREWSDAELQAFTENDVKFALGSSTEEMRELLRTRPNDKGDSQ